MVNYTVIIDYPTHISLPVYEAGVGYLLP